MFDDRLLDLEGGNVFSAPSNRVLDAADIPKVSILIETTGIPGVKPPVAPGSESRLRIFIVASGIAPRALATNHDLARLAGSAVEIIGVDHPDLPSVARTSRRTY